MKVVLELSPGLASIYPQLGPRISLDLDPKPLALAQVLKLAGIQPMLVLKGLVGEEAMGLDGMIQGDCEIKLISPLSGG